MLILMKNSKRKFTLVAAFLHEVIDARPNEKLYLSVEQVVKQLSDTIATVAHHLRYVFRCSTH
jgi:hypothetical protein